MHYNPKSTAVPLLPLHAFMAGIRWTLSFMTSR